MPTAVEAFSGIIDAHVHLYADEVNENPLAWGRAHHEPWWTNCVAPVGKPSLQGWASLDQLLRDMDAAGIERCLLLGWYWENQASCELQNAWYGRWIRHHSDRLSAFAAVQPTSGTAALDGLERARDAGLCGIGECKAPVQGFSFTDPCWESVVHWAQEHRFPINLHVTDPVACKPGAAVKATPLEDFVTLAESFPEAIFILAHWGGGLPFYELNPRIRRIMRQVYYDSAASPLLYDPAVFTQVSQLIGYERILFGTDYPLLCFPRQEKAPGFLRNVQAAIQHLPHDARSQVLRANALRLLGIL